MPIKSVTSVAGGKGAGKTFLCTMLNAKSFFYLIEESTSKTKAELFEMLDKWKTETTVRNVVLEGDVIYKLIDYDFGNIDRYYVSLQKKPAFVYVEEKEPKPILGD